MSCCCLVIIIFISAFCFALIQQLDEYKMTCRIFHAKVLLAVTMISTLVNTGLAVTIAAQSRNFTPGNLSLNLSNETK